MGDKKFSHQFFVLLIFLCSSFFSSQETKQTAKDIDKLIINTNQLYLDGKTKQYLVNSKKIINQSIKLKYKKGFSYGYYYLAVYYYDSGEFRESIRHAKKAENNQDYLSKDLTLSAKLSALLGRNYLSFEMYTLSEKNYRKTLTTLAGKTEKDTTDSLTESSAYSNLSYLFQNINMPDSTYFYLNKEKHTLKKIKFKDAFVENGCSCLGLGNYHLTSGKKDSAQRYYKKSLVFFTNKKHVCKIESLIGLGDLYTQQKDYKKAHQYYDFAQSSVDGSSFPDIQSEIFKKKSELYISEGNAAKAKKYQDLYIKLHNKLNNQQRKERDFAVSEMMQEKKEQHEQEVKKNQKFTLFIILILILTTAFIIYLLKKAKVKNQKTLEITKRLISENAVQEKEKDCLKLQVNESFDEIRKLAKENSSDFFTRFQEVYPQFTIKMLAINPKFKVSELTFTAYIYLGFNTKEIADYTFKAVKTVENNRYNLRKKLGISPEKDLQIWLRNYIDSE